MNQRIIRKIDIAINALFSALEDSEISYGYGSELTIEIRRAWSEATKAFNAVCNEEGIQN